MDLDKLAVDIKQSLAYTTHLQQEKESLQHKICTLKDYIVTLEGLLKEKEESQAELLKQSAEREDGILDKIILLQTDHKLKEDFKTLTHQHNSLLHEFEEACTVHAAFVEEMTLASEEKIAELRSEHGRKVEELEERCGTKTRLLETEVHTLREKMEEAEKQRIEEQVKMQQGYEEKLHVLQRSASSSVNVDIYKRKLAAQRMEFMREIELLKGQIQGHPSTRGRPFRRGR